MVRYDSLGLLRSVLRLPASDPNGAMVQFAKPAKNGGAFVGFSRAGFLELRRYAANGTAAWSRTLSSLNQLGQPFSESYSSLSVRDLLELEDGDALIALDYGAPKVRLFEELPAAMRQTFDLESSDDDPGIDSLLIRVGGAGELSWGFPIHTYGRLSGASALELFELSKQSAMLSLTLPSKAEGHYWFEDRALQKLPVLGTIAVLFDPATGARRSVLNVPSDSCRFQRSESAFKCLVLAQRISASDCLQYPSPTTLDGSGTRLEAPTPDSTAVSQIRFDPTDGSIQELTRLTLEHSQNARCIDSLAESRWAPFSVWLYGPASYVLKNAVGETLTQLSAPTPGSVRLLVFPDQVGP